MAMNTSAYNSLFVNGRFGFTELNITYECPFTLTVELNLQINFRLLHVTRSIYKVIFI